MKIKLFSGTLGLFSLTCIFALSAHDAKNAQLNYEKALTLDPAKQNAKEMLKKLKDLQQN